MKSTLTKLTALLRQPLLKAPSYKNIVILAGIGKSSFGIVEVGACMMAFKKSIEKFKEGGIDSKSFFVGELNSGISTQEFDDKLKDIAHQTEGNISFILYSHAFPLKDKDGKFLDLGITLNLNRIPSKDFFSIISQNFGARKTDVFITSCRGSLALAHVGQLSKGSTVFACGEEQELMHYQELENFTKSIEKSKELADLSVNEIWKTYLSYGLKYEISPSVAVSGFPELRINLRENLTDKIGKEISAPEQTLIHEKLDKFIGEKRVQFLLDQIAKAGYLGVIKKPDYGASLLVAFELENSRKKSNIVENPVSRKFDLTSQHSRDI